MSTNLDNDKLNEQKEGTAVGGLYGWICPVCGRGLSPYTSSCPCTINREITCGTGTAVPQLGTVISYNAPTADLREDVAPVIHGEWIECGKDDNDMTIVQCSICQIKRYGAPAYCSRCGAKMDGGNSNES